MRHFTVLILFIAALFSFNHSSAQKVVEKGKNFVDVGIGIGAFNTKWHYEVLDTVINDNAASMRIPLGYERAFTDRLTGGAQLVFSKYLTDSTSTTDNARSTDLVLRGNFHLLNKEKVSLYAGLTLGFDALKITDGRDIFTYKASGSAIGGNLGLRILPVENFFIDFLLGGQGYNLDGKFEDALGNSFGLDLKASGFTLGLSLGGRF